MSTDEFADPGEEFTGVRINPKDCLGHLLLIWVIEYLPHKPTLYSRPDKPSDVIVVDCVDLDVTDPETGEQGLLARHTWWRQAKLIQKLKSLVGTPTPYLGVMGKGGASQGYNAPFVLSNAKDDPGAVQRAKEWRSRNPNFTPSQPFEAMTTDTQASTGTSDPVQPQRQETLLERLARQSQQPRPFQTGGTLPPPEPQGKIPF